MFRQTQPSFTQSCTEQYQHGFRIGRPKIYKIYGADKETTTDIMLTAAFLNMPCFRDISNTIYFHSPTISRAEMVLRHCNDTCDVVSEDMTRMEYNNWYKANYMRK